MKIFPIAKHKDQIQMFGNDDLINVKLYDQHPDYWVIRNQIVQNESVKGMVFGEGFFWPFFGQKS